MRMEDGHNYQPVMIRTLLQNKGKATRDEIKYQLHKANPLLPQDHFNDSPVFDVLTKSNLVAEYDEQEKIFKLLDYETISVANKAVMVRYCNEKIENPFGIKLKEINLDELISEFREWLKTDKIIKQKKIIEKEKKEVQDLMQELSTMDKKSSEFTELVLYGLLPNYKSRFAKRISTFPVFLNIKLFLKNYNYSDDEWTKIANMIYDLASKSQKEPDKLGQWIEEFVSDKIHTRMIQCGSISPILFCINDSFPVINNKIIRTYKEFSIAFGWDDKMSQKFESYIANIEKCKKLIDFLGIIEVKDLAVFDLFCWWYDEIKKADEVEEVKEEEEEGGFSRTGLEEIQYDQFLSSIDLENLKKLEPHVLRNPERIKIGELLQICKNGKWQLPNFQRYFDWNKTDIRDLLDSVFRDFYIGSLLLWEIDKEPSLKLIPILGAKLPNDDVRTDMIILDGQQRITSLYYAIKGVTEPTKNIKKPIYYYINLRRFLEGHEDKNIVMSEQKLTREESIKTLYFPFYELEKHAEWIDAFEDAVGNQENYAKVKDVWRFIERKLKHFIEGFEIPYVTLPSTVDLPQVTDIFEQLNTKGKTLSVFDILIATLSKYDIDLRQLWDDAVRNYPLLKEYNSRDKLPIYILQSIALSYHHLSLCSRNDLLKMYQTIIEPKNLSFEEIWDEMTQWVYMAILKLENLRDGFGVKGRKSLPYLPTIPILASFLRKNASREDKVECLSKINMWYWSSIFSEMYSSGVDTQLTTDYREMVGWEEDGNKILGWIDDESKIIKSVEKFRREFPATLDLRSIERENNATYRGILSLLALEGAPDFDTNLNLENALENDKHHIFPKKPFGDFKNVNSILNITWLSDETNRKIIRDKKPSTYIQNFVKEKYGGNEEKFQKVLEKHFINEKSFEHMFNDNFEGFISEREKIIRSKIGDLIGLKSYQPPQTLLSPETPFDNEMIIEETFKKCEEYIHWPDKYFRTKGLKWLRNYLQKDKVKEIKILTSIDTVTEELRDLFKAFRKQMSNDDVSCHMRVIVDNKLKGQIHGRWLITKDDCFSFQSVDTVSRGAYDEIRGGAARPPFDEWWKSSLDIIDDWNKINDKKNS